MKCEHRGNKKLCKKCDGQSLCSHGKEPRFCIVCDGKGICEHGAVRTLCRVCCPLGWAKCDIRHLRKHAINGGYEPPNITPEEVVAMMLSAKTCVLCGEELDWTEGHHLHHDHKTGKVEGFAHGFCNITEGRIMRLSPRARHFFLARIKKVQ